MNAKYYVWEQTEDDNGDDHLTWVSMAYTSRQDAEQAQSDLQHQNDDPRKAYFFAKRYDAPTVAS